MIMVAVVGILVILHEWRAARLGSVLQKQLFKELRSLPFIHQETVTQPAGGFPSFIQRASGESIQAV